jgi:hypothetical protein
MFKNLKNFIQNLQTAGESRKKRWLFILSGAAMILVISVWALYINRTIVNLGTAESTKQQTATKNASESFWQVFSTGIKTIADQIKNLIKTSREIIIEENSPDFAPKPETGQ